MRSCTASLHAFKTPVSTGAATWASAADMRIEASLIDNQPRGY